MLNESINKNYLTGRRTIYKSNELFETSKLLENCTSCEDKIGECYFDRFHQSINEIEYLFNKLEKEKQEETENGNMIDDLGGKLQ